MRSGWHSLPATAPSHETVIASVIPQDATSRLPFLWVQGRRGWRTATGTSRPCRSRGRPSPHRRQRLGCLSHLRSREQRPVLAVFLPINRRRRPTGGAGESGLVFAGNNNKWPRRRQRARHRAERPSLWHDGRRKDREAEVGARREDLLLLRPRLQSHLRQRPAQVRPSDVERLRSSLSTWDSPSRLGCRATKRLRRVL